MTGIRFPWRRIRLVWANRQRKLPGGEVVASTRQLTLPVRLTSILLLAVGVMTVAGCASKSAKVSVSGKVTSKGEAVGWGNVRFFSPDGTLWSTAPLNPDGTFTATDVPQGEVQVALQPLPIPPTAMRKKDGSAANEKGLAFPSKFIAIPPKYQEPKTSGLRFTIGPGANSLDIPLQQTNEQNL